MGPNIKLIGKDGGEGVFHFSVKKLRKDFDGKTQAVRGALIADLEAIEQLAAERVQSAHSPREKQRWAHVAAYVAQTVAYLAGAYDTAEVDARIRKLEGMVAELLKRQKARGAGEAGSGAP